MVTFELAVDKTLSLKIKFIFVTYFFIFVDFILCLQCVLSFTSQIDSHIGG